SSTRRSPRAGRFLGREVRYAQTPFGAIYRGRRSNRSALAPREFRPHLCAVISNPNGAPMSVSLRDFLAAGATAAAGVALGNPLLGEAPGITHRTSITASSAGAFARPIVIASENGIRGVKKAYDMIVAGADTLDAIIAGVNIQELDPDDMSVGLGGLPNRS